jgi:surfeit locus 1 family protein
MPLRIRVFVLTALVAVALFVRLGAWQVGRLNERRAQNARLMGRREAAPVALATVASQGSAEARFRRVRLHGRYDYGSQVIWTARSRNGAPGVAFLTPVVPDSGSANQPAILVHRGWAYAADGMTVDDTLWREGEDADVEGYLEVFPAGAGPVVIAAESRLVRRLDAESLRTMIPYPVAPMLVIQQKGAGEQPGTVRHPFRVEAPTMDEGPHRGYALQWFAFAGITVLGTVAVVLRERENRRRGAPPI